MYVSFPPTSTKSLSLFWLISKFPESLWWDVRCLTCFGNWLCSICISHFMATGYEDFGSKFCSWFPILHANWYTSSYVLANGSILNCLLQVSCFGSDADSDTGDYWRWDLFSLKNVYYSSWYVCGPLPAKFYRLMIEGSGKTWKQEQKIRLQHVDTGGYLHSHDKKYSRIAGGQQEVRTTNNVVNNQRM